MKLVNKILFSGLGTVLLSGCTAMYVHRSYDEETVIQEEIVEVEDTIEQPILIGVPSPVPYPIAVESKQEEPKTKLRTNGENNNSQKAERKSDNNESNTRNNSGQRNTKSRGK